MDEGALRKLLDAVRDGTTSADDAVTALRELPFADLDFARVDHHRLLRQGLGEVIYGPGKSAAQCVAIVRELLRTDTSPVLLSRATTDQTRAVLDAHPGGVAHERDGHDGHDAATTVVWRPRPTRADLADADAAPVVLLTAGTADLPVADECATVLAAHGVPTLRFADVGVAGLHRLTDAIPPLLRARAVVVVAGMEGALASVVGGLTAAPVVAVPTSVGYGSSLAGVTALLAMLASCASGITVVGIDNGFGAAQALLRLLGPLHVQEPLSTPGRVTPEATAR